MNYLTSKGIKKTWFWHLFGVETKNHQWDNTWSNFQILWRNSILGYSVNHPTKRAFVQCSVIMWTCRSCRKLTQNKQEVPGPLFLLKNTTSYTVKNPYKYKLKSRNWEVDFKENNLFLLCDQKVYSKPKITRGPWATLLTWENSSNQ